MLRVFAASAALLALSGCATTPAATESARDCFRASDVNGYTLFDEHSVRVSINPQRQYKLTIAGPARNLDWTRALTLRTRANFICVGDPAGVEFVGGDPPIQYQVTQIERLPPDAPEGS